MGANESSPFYYNRVKGKLEHDLMELGLQQLSIIRPSLLVGERNEFRLGEKIGEKVLKLAKPFLMGPLKRSRAIEATQVAKAMMIIALHGKQQPVTIYPSHELAILAFPETAEKDVSRETLFNWDKIKKADSLHEEDKVNRDVVIDREKYNIHDKVVDKEVHFRPYDKE